MATMNLTAISMERELRYQNKSLFDNFVWFDDPDEHVDREQLKNRILMRCGEFEVLYSDPEFFASCINVWSAAYKRTFDKWLLAIYSEYNPIENYNMEERFQDDGTGSKAASGSNTKNMENTSNGTSTFDGTIVNSQNSSADSTSNHNVSAFDSANYSPESQDIISDSAQGSSTETNENTATTNTSGTAEETGSHTDNETTETQNIHTGMRHGNIGVTTSQQMLEQEFKVALFSFYDRVADLFVKEFCVMVY